MAKTKLKASRIRTIEPVTKDFLLDCYYGIENLVIEYSNEYYVYFAKINATCNEVGESYCIEEFEKDFSPSIPIEDAFIQIGFNKRGSVENDDEKVDITIPGYEISVRAASIGLIDSIILFYKELVGNYGPGKNKRRVAAAVAIAGASAGVAARKLTSYRSPKVEPDVAVVPVTVVNPVEISNPSLNVQASEQEKQRQNEEETRQRKWDRKQQIITICWTIAGVILGWLLNKFFG